MRTFARKFGRAFHVLPEQTIAKNSAAESSQLKTGRWLSEREFCVVLCSPHLGQVPSMPPTFGFGTSLKWNGQPRSGVASLLQLLLQLRRAGVVVEPGGQHLARVASPKALAGILGAIDRE